MRTISLILLLTPALASGVTSTEYATADAYISQSNPNSNYGAEDSLYIGCNGENVYFVTYLKFDLTDYMGYIIDDATLNVYCSHINYVGPDYPTILYGVVENDWDEMTITWNNTPGSINETVEEYAQPSSQGWWYLDVTTIVQYWLDDVYDNTGFEVFNWIESTSSEAIFNSREHSQNNPYLELNYPVPVESESLGEIKAIFK